MSNPPKQEAVPLAEEKGGGEREGSSPFRFFGSLDKYDTLRRQQNSNSGSEAAFGPINITGNNSSNSNSNSNINIDIFDDYYNGGNGEETTIGLCHFIAMNWYALRDESDGKLRKWLTTDYALETTAAIALALEHLNTGNGSVVQEVEGLDKRCDLRFTAEFWDTEGDEVLAVDQIVSLLNHPPNNNKIWPCAFLGPLTSTEAIATSLLTGLKGYPQISPSAMSAKLDDKHTYSLFGRVIPSTFDVARPTLDYLYKMHHVRHLVIVHDHDEFSLSLQEGFVATASTYYFDMTVRTVSLPHAADEADYEATVRRLAQTKIRYIYAAVGVPHYEPLMKAAYKHKIAGDGEHNWFVYNSGILTVNFVGREFDLDSPLRLSGIGLTAIYIKSLPCTGHYDEFLEAWDGLGSSEGDMKYLQSKVPANDGRMDGSYVPDITSLTFDDARKNVDLSYDAAILLGLAACDALNSTSGVPMYLDGHSYYKSILNKTFVGASGRVTLDHATGTRDPSSAVFVADVLVPREVDGNKSMWTFDIVSSANYDNGEWDITIPPIFNDGTTRPPPDLPEPVIRMHFIGPGLRSICWLLSAIVLLMSCCLAVWTRVNRNERVVRSSQPFFLYLICFGTFLMGSSIVAIGMDDEIMSTRACDVSCMLYPWLLSLGWVFAFSALFTKTIRIVKVLHNPTFRKITVTVFDVLKPMLLLLGVNFCLLTLMTIIAPFYWDRVEVDYDEFDRVTESRGRCVSDHGIAFIVISIVVDLGTLLIALYQAYTARNISTEFAESESIARAISCIFMVSFVGIPVVYIAEGDRKAFFFVLSSVIFVICMSLLLFIFVPKIISNRSKVLRPIRESIQASAINFARTSTPSMESSNDDDDMDGAKVIDHPKMREDMKAQNRQLKQLVDTLAARVDVLEGLLLQANDNKQEVQQQHRAETESLAPEAHDKQGIEQHPDDKSSQAVEGDNIAL